MRYVIDIPEDAKIAFDNAESNDLKGGYYDLGGIIGNAIKNGKPLDAVLDEIRAEINTPNRGTCDYFIVDRIEEIIDKYKAESEEAE